MVDTMLHDSPDLVIHRTEIWAVWMPQVGLIKRSAFHDAAVQLLHAARCAGALSCWNTKSLPDTLRIAGSSMTSSWRREAASKKRYHQNFLLCNNNEITACIADLFNKILWSTVCRAVAFFKVMHQQTVGKVGNSMMCLWADNFCL